MYIFEAIDIPDFFGILQKNHPVCIVLFCKFL